MVGASEMLLKSAGAERLTPENDAAIAEYSCAESCGYVMK